jgi:hypothetical protein
MTAVLVSVVLLPATARAQVGEASITGVVRDVSGAVLPGVTVEAASPVLIEKVRSVVTDGTGQYRIVNLGAGTYTVTFTLPGFNTFKREGLELTGSFTATVNAELQVGAVEETITVAGETPIVDVQSTRQQRVLDHEVIDTVPAGRSLFFLAVLIPGVSFGQAGQQDVGGSGTVTQTATLTIHGSRGDDQKMLQNGIAMTAQGSTGHDAPMPYNPAATQEVTLDTSSVSPEMAMGGVRINIIPRDGGNTFKGTFYGNYSNNSLQGNNLTSELKAAGFRFPDSVKKNWDMNPGVGGPIKRDKLWFFLSGRYKGEQLYAAGIYTNLNANNPNAWTYEPDLNSPGENRNSTKDGQLRLTWQATPRNKLGVVHHEQTSCACPTAINATRAPEATNNRVWPTERQIQADWTAPATNRLLFEAGALWYRGSAGAYPAKGLHPSMIGVTEQSTGLLYRTGDPTYRNRFYKNLHSRAAASYITGAHAFKVGLSRTQGFNQIDRYMNQPVTYRFNNGVPNQLTQIAYPSNYHVDVDHDMGFFAQDRWTIARLTLSYGTRYSYFASSSPEQTLGPTLLTPTRNTTYPKTPGLNWKDITPHVGAAYDLFGDGKTALKVSLNKYLEAMAGEGLAAALSPVNTVVLTTTRSWTDANRNYVPECDLLNTTANGECGAMANPNFGKNVVTATFDPDITTGWGKRGFNWEFSAGVQHELIPSVAVNVGYFRRWFGNFTVIDNRTVAPSDFNRFSITGPSDPRLPSGGGYVITDLYDLNPSKFGLPADNYQTFASNYGTQIDHWNGFDITASARLQSGVLIQGGLSTGHRTTDTCEVVAALDNPSQRFCHVQEPFLTQVKLLGSYTVPRVDVLVSGTFQSLPGPLILANFNAPNALVAPSLGRPLSGGAANITVNLVEPGSMYGGRLNQFDVRLGKVLRFGRTSTIVNFDLYNALNASTALAVNNNYAAWQRATTVLQPRFAKFSVQFDF